MRVVSIVEGQGEVAALPILLRRLNEWHPAVEFVDPLRPIRVRRDRFLNKEDEFRKQLSLAALKCGDGGWILIVLDADDDCPAALAKQIFERAQEYVSHRKLSVVIAKREYEAWFIAAARSLDGFRGFHSPDDLPIDPELPRDAKGWLRGYMEDSAYREILDQPALTQAMNLQQAYDNSRSFRKLCKEWVSYVRNRD